MGVGEQKFVDWLDEEFPGVVQPLPDNPTSHFETVCIDINPLLHKCISVASTEAEAIKALFNILDKYLRVTVPHGTVLLAVDGSPPVAKFKEQIRRRRTISASTRDKLDPAQITPGCAFMVRVTQYLHYYAARYLANKRHDPYLRFIVSGAETNGEGEAKNHAVH